MNMEMQGFRVTAVNEDQELQVLLDKIYRDKGFDFRQYREKSLRRRLERRLHATKAKSYEEYTAILDRDGAEYGRLIDSLTINITQFLRDPEAFDMLAKVVFPEVVFFADSHEQKEIRIWSAGCAGGEEPYSIVMLLGEVLARRLRDFHITVYATDIDENSLARAREGKYDAATISKLPEVLVERHFTYDGQYRIRHKVRQLVEFKQHNLVSDEPFTGLDLVSCRNVVMYFSRDLQEQVFMDFHHGLRQGGFLFLGKAETLSGESARLFHTVDKRWRVYQKDGHHQMPGYHHDLPRRSVG